MKKTHELGSNRIPEKTDKSGVGSDNGKLALENAPSIGDRLEKFSQEFERALKALERIIGHVLIFILVVVTLAYHVYTLLEMGATPLRSI